jgi:hypothetical protein
MSLDVPALHAKLMHTCFHRWDSLSAFSNVQFFAAIINTTHLPPISDPLQFERILLGKWSLADAHRPRLHQFASSPAILAAGWPSSSSSLSKQILAATILDLQKVLTAVWGAPFAQVLSPFAALFVSIPDTIFLFSTAYIAAQVERALDAFAVIVGEHTPGGPYALARKSAAGCAQLLSDLMQAAANVAQWEPYPCHAFFAPEGLYQSTFQLRASSTVSNPATQPASKRKNAGPPHDPRAAPGVPPVKKSKVDPTTPCFAHMAGKLKLPTLKGPHHGCTFPNCNRSHYIRPAPLSRAALEAALAESTFTYKTELLAALAADKGKVVTFPSV